MKNQTRRGLGLIELITLLAVGFVLVTLLLPQIQAAREAARRAQCVNNFKQISPALHNYHAVFASLPMSAVRDAGHGNGHSGFTHILAFLEQTAAYNGYNFHLENWHAASATTMIVQVGAYVCPSDQRPDPVRTSDVRTAHDEFTRARTRSPAATMG